MIRLLTWGPRSLIDTFTDRPVPHIGYANHGSEGQGSMGCGEATLIECMPVGGRLAVLGGTVEGCQPRLGEERLLDR